MDAITDRMIMRYLREVTYGETPASAMQNLYIVSEDITPGFQTVESETMLGDRQVRDAVRVGQMSQGSINFELAYGPLDDVLEGVLCDDWQTGFIENGSDLISFSLEREFDDVNQFASMKGARMGTLALNFVPKQRVTGSVGLMARGARFAGSTIGTGSATAGVDAPMMVTTETLSIEEAGTPITLATGFTINVDNGLRAKDVLGSSDIRDIGLGTFRVTGTLEAYFEDRRFIDKLIADTASDFEIVTEDVDSFAYNWIFPRFKFTGLTGPNATARNTDVMTRLNWTAFRDPSTGITMRVER